MNINIGILFIVGIILGISIGVLIGTLIYAKQVQQPLKPEPEVEKQTIVAQKDEYKITERQATINLPSRGEPLPFETLGTLVSARSDSIDKPPIILPLIGRQQYPGSQTWEYYTMFEKLHPLRISVQVNEKDCSSNTGCKELYDGDQVYVTEYQRNFTVKLYTKNQIRYIPF
jgi:uncharacterized protein YneF (UPF0154 family)